MLQTSLCEWQHLLRTLTQRKQKWKQPCNLCLCPAVHSMATKPWKTLSGAGDGRGNRSQFFNFTIFFIIRTITFCVLPTGSVRSRWGAPGSRSRPSHWATSLWCRVWPRAGWSRSPSGPSATRGTSCVGWESAPTTQRWGSCAEHVSVRGTSHTSSPQTLHSLANPRCVWSHRAARGYTSARTSRSSPSPSVEPTRCGPSPRTEPCSTEAPCPRRTLQVSRGRDAQCETVWATEKAQ